MTQTRKIGIALVAVLAMLIACVCGALPVAAEEEPVMDPWHETEDGQFLYADESWFVPGLIQFVYIGDGTDVTVPSTVNGKPVEKVWLANGVRGLLGTPEEEAGPWLDKINASAQRYLNVTFEEGPTYVLVEPNVVPGYVRVNSLTLPKSATSAHLYLKGATAVTAPEGSELTSFGLENVLEGVEDPQPTTIDLTGAVGLKQVNISRVDYGGDCFIEGSVLKLPDTLKRVKVTRPLSYQDPDDTYISIDYEPMPLTIEYADGSGRPVTFSGDANGDDMVNMKDVLYLRQVIAGLMHVELWDGLFMLGADMNHDGEVNMKDVFLIRCSISTPPWMIQL